MSGQSKQVVDVGLSTDVGLVRQNNEDCLYADPHCRFFIVSDGMGGVDGGEVASGLIGEALPKMLEPLLENKQTLSHASTVAEIQESIHAVNNLIYRQGMEQGLNGMGATLTLGILDKEQVYTFQIGDSRVYGYRNARLKQLTVDQVEQQDGHEVLTHVMGMEEHVQADVKAYHLNNFSCLLLCSDGLHHMISEEEITSVLMDGTAQSMAENLVQKANDAGGEDNCSVIVIQLSG